MSVRHVCFVCGSLGAESGLRIKPHDRLPYFPFLEHHDPPKGARLPTSNGTVDCCRVCYAFLTQQWETYERSKTPAIKRLYWLKRADNGHFTGAEMRLQGEYIAQIMGLNYQPGVEGRGSPDNSTRDYPPSPPYRKEEQAAPSSNHSSHGDQGLNYKSETKSHVKPKLSSQPRVETPVLTAHHSSKGGHSEGVLDLTVRKEQKTKVTTAPSEKEQTIICYICAQSTLVRNCKYVSTARNSTSEPFFPVLQKISQPEGAFPLNQHGQAIVCGECRLLLYQQWQAYELAGVPFQNRIYKLCDDKLKTPKSEPGSHIDRRPRTPIETDEYVCYLCGKLYDSDLIRLLYTVPPHDPTMGTLFFPFVQELQRPKGAQPLKSDGSVLSCRNCYAELYQQWQVQETMQIPVYQRKYSLSFATPSSREVSESHLHGSEITNGPDRKRPVVKSEATHPLNIHISEGMPGSSSLSSGGLLAIAVSEEKQHGVSTSCISPNKLSTLLKRPYENLSTGSSIPHPLEQAVSKPKKICFLCGERSRMMNTHVINAYPVTQETKSNNTMVLPFFPFLRNSNPAPGADLMTEEGSVIVCSICFHMLLKQWNLFEEYPNAETINRWHRRYVMPDFVCYICAKRTDRKQVKMLESAKFPFLKDIKCPPDSLILNGGQLVIACKPCALDLNQQFSEYERLKVPIGLRKYNWVQRTMGFEHGDHESYLGREEKESYTEGAENREVDVESVDEGGSESGLQPGAKPPSISTMMSPAASKLSRNTATVPPLNQVSPSNGVTSVSASAAMSATRTASFAAALRKLAHQAKDPEDTTPSHSSQPGSSSASPRAVTPKRGPPPLVYNSHSSSLTSPPVVTIAPTQAHPTIPSTETKQSIERAHSVQSTASSVYEALSLKQERERPQSTHSNRDDDRNSLKDLSISRSRMTPHSVHSSSPAGLREEAIGRGFQPYRPGDDLRHQLPPAAFGLDPATAAAYSAAYPAAAFLPPHPFPHPAFRFDDPLLLERYRMMQPPYLPFGHPGMLPPPGMHQLLASGRYPPELLHQQFPFVSSASRLPDHISPSLSERQRLEEERYRELEREKEREKELEREREKDKELMLREKERGREREKEERDKGHYYGHISDGSRKDRSGSLGGGDLHRLPRVEELGMSRFGSITQGTAKDVHSRKESRSDKVMESDRPGREGERGSVPLPSNLEHSYKRDEKYSQLFSTGPKEDVRFTALQSLDRNASSSHSSNSATEPRTPKSSDSNFFRPFDTKSLTNGFHSGTASEVDKFSTSFKSLSDQRNKTDTPHKHKYRDDGHHSLHRHNNDLSSSNDHKLRQDKPPRSSKTSSSTEDSKRGSNSVHSHSLLSTFNHKSEHGHKHKSTNHSSSHHHHHSHHQESQRAVRSRLDVEEQRLRRKRAVDPYYTDSDEEEDTEEQEKERLLLITSGPSLPVDENPEKMEFFETLGLTSLRVKKELDFERLRNRRRMHHERSVSPVEVHSGDSAQGEISNLSTPPQSVSEQMCQDQDFPQKCSFLNSFELSVVDRNKKKELEQIKNVCEEERKRRLSDDSQTGSKKRKMNLSDSESKNRGKGKKTEGKTLGFSLMSKTSNRDACREFAEEFHQSVLLSTQRKALRHDMKLGSMESLSSSGGSEGSDLEQPVPNWPGLNSVIQSYQNYLSEQTTEKKVLQEKCKLLQSQNSHLMLTAKSLKQRELEMLNTKKEMNEKRVETQSAIDKLKRCLKDLH